MASPTDEQMADARKRVDAASDEAVSLAMDALHDRALEKALWERLERQNAPDAPPVDNLVREQEKPTRSSREMLERIARAGDRGLMQLQISANGRSEYNKMRRLVWAGWAEICQIRLQEGRDPVPGVRITASGKEALAD